jgi:hypothetical protein
MPAIPKPAIPRMTSGEWEWRVRVEGGGPAFGLKT